VDPKSSSFSIILLLISGVMRHRMIAALALDDAVVRKSARRRVTELAMGMRLAA